MLYRFICAIVAICLWATLCLQLFADPIMARIIAAPIDTWHAFYYSWVIACLTSLIWLLGSTAIIHLSGANKWAA